MTEPGWYPDPDDATARRYFDGETWSPPLHAGNESATRRRQPPRRRLPFLKWLVLAPFLVAAGLFMFLPIHEQVLGTSVDCGAALHARGIDPDAIQASVLSYLIDQVNENPDAPASEDPDAAQLATLARAAASDCKSEGSGHVTWALWLTIGGLAVASSAWRWERSPAS